MPASRSNSLVEEPPAPPVVALRALDLLAQWRRALGGHVPLAGLGCAACGMGAASVAVGDFEVPILDYLHGRHGGDARLRALFVEAGYAEGRSGQVSELLAALARSRDAGPAAMPLLADLQRSIASFAQVHR